MKQLIENSKQSVMFLLLILSITKLQAGAYKLYSPDRQIAITVETGEQLTWSVSFGDRGVLYPSEVAMDFDNGLSAGKNISVKKAHNRTIDQIIEATIPSKERYIRDYCNELELNAGSYSVYFRAYNNGVAYRFATNLKEKEVCVTGETTTLNFAGNFIAYWPEEDDPEFYSHFEAVFDKIRLSEVPADKYGYLPVYLAANDVKMVITETDVTDYPHLLLFGSGSSTLTGKLPPVILETIPDEQAERPDRTDIITKKAPYLARTRGKRSYPWRIIAISKDDKGIVENNLPFQLAPPQAVKETAWIKPGKVAWDWWNDNNIHGVDFRAGLNTETYKYYIDFAARYGLEYIVLDEGWSATTLDIKNSTADIDIPALVAYGKEKNVGIIVWVLFHALDKDVEGTLDIYKNWGIQGIKVDFLQRADQWMVNWYERVAKAAYDRKMIVDYHSSFKPAGITRKYPNVLTFEGVKGLENVKWAEFVTPTHNLILPFTRMVAGPMDYTPGATRNETAEGFYPSYTTPMSQSTRAHQAAMYVVYESPLQMLSDSPSNYYATPDFTGFIARMPVIWDKTIALHGKAGEYIALARKNNKNWYIGAMTNEEERTLTIQLDFLETGTYALEWLKDGINADRYAGDFKTGKNVVRKGDTLTLEMKSGGGWAGILTPLP